MQSNDCPSVCWIMSKIAATSGLPVSRYDLFNVFFILLECCLRCQGLLLSLKSSKVNQHLDAKCGSTGPVPQRPEGPDRTKSDKLKSLHLQYSLKITTLCFPLCEASFCVAHYIQSVCVELENIQIELKSPTCCRVKRTTQSAGSQLPELACGRNKHSHLESQSPPSRQDFSLVRVRLSWASSRMESWISLVSSLRLILQRFRYSSINSWSSQTLCWG